MNTIFLIQERAYYKIMSGIKNEIMEVKNMYSIIGDIDAFISIALYRNNIGSYSVPILKKEA